MTTVAYRMGMIAADTGVNLGDIRIGRITKIARHPSGLLIGASGTAGFCMAFLHWVLDGQDPDAEPEPCTYEDGGMERGIIVKPATPLVVRVLEPEGWFDLPCPYFAMGTGREIALGAFWKGADAQEAVSAAMEHDSNTWGTVEHLRF